MKNLLYSLLGLLFILPACNKTISGDSPLDKVRKQAVYISTNNNNLISYDAVNGNKLWEAILKGANEGVPVLLNQKVYFVTNAGYLYGIDIYEGKILLEKNISIAALPLINTQPSLALHSNKLIVASDKLYCFDTLGNQQWNYDPGVPCSTSPTVTNGKVFVGCMKNIHCVDASNGNFIWSSTPIVDLDPNDIIASSPRVSNGLVYFGADNKKVYALNESNGAIKWQYTAGDKVMSSPLVYGGMCIVGSQDFSIHCIDTTTGLKRWTYPTLERVYSSPVVHEITNSVLIGSYDFNLYAIDHVSGQLKWKYPAGSLIKASPVVMGEYVYFNSFDRYLYCVDVRNGSLVWKQFLNGSSESSPMVDDGVSAVSPGISGMSKY